MHPHAQNPGGLRLAPADLPPTLQPQVILASAPRPDRCMSILGASAVYLAAGAGMILVGREAPRITLGDPGRVGPPIILQPEPAARTLPPAQAVVRTAATDPPPSRMVPADCDVPPVETPPELPSEDRSRYGARVATDEDLRTGRVEAGPEVSGRSEPGTAGRGTVRDLGADPPRVLHAENPQYPALARATRVQGPVELLMTIDERGVPVRVEVLSGHPAFHAEAERAARSWRFEAATQEGRAVSARFRLTILFRLA